MEFQSPLERVTLLRRYKRFLADIELADGTIAVAHCPNPGAMTGLAEAGQEIWVMPTPDPRKKLDFSWKLSRAASGALVVIDTMAANQVVKEALLTGGGPNIFGPYDAMRSEPKLPDGGRSDFALMREDQEQLVEVKSVSLSRQAGRAEFPDTVTERGRRHMETLAKLARAGQPCAILFLVMRNDCVQLSCAQDIDPKFYQALRIAQAAGVEILANSLDVSEKTITLGAALTFEWKF